ncbi:GNAT family N-acetyltransferase [Hymenobacter persicinus]|uniref:N-acetyltransferase n=1 Tax=Hymenobacter persicinus TaxID=2025506 RepID=A0A4Q5LEX4_9BACT|nr:GNAT family N-acetyltransferase [Hymenobacter persicinus]RYU81317.1 N-acetyltransferase [Hymenobacter persicinus]
MQTPIPLLHYHTAAPRLETDRLLLRGCQATDLPAFAAMWAEPDFYRYLGGQPLAEEDVWTKLQRTAGHWPLMGFGYWAVEEKATGHFLGLIGFSDFHRAMEPSIQGVPEIGWVLAPHSHGKGYATEAIRAVLAWGDEQFGRARTVCIIDPQNQASLRVAEKCGYRLIGEAIYKEQPILLLERAAG